MTKRLGPSGEELEVMDGKSSGLSAATTAATNNQTQWWQWVFVGLWAVALMWFFSPSPSRTTVAAPARDMSRTTGLAIGCPSMRGIELVLEASPQGDGAVAATSLVNDCTLIPTGTAVAVVQATGSYVLIKDRDTGVQRWVISEVAFKN